ncbi:MULTISPECIES: hypothetical protein [unclassified Streptomyces]|uniref:hypothetical protein n=1 Tax=unclassified Streptomyces TaxID=2593676 RepID=UPI001F5B2C1B|nr:hypothetical protein [Streptomyces sp. HSG2]
MPLCPGERSGGVVGPTEAPHDPTPDGAGGGPPRAGRSEARRLRRFVTAGLAACAVVVPYAVVTPVPEITTGRAGTPSVGPGAGGLAPRAAPGGGRPAGTISERPGGTVPHAEVDPTAGPGARATGSPTRRALVPGRATAVRCGPRLTSADGAEAQTCVLVQGGRIWARAYYRNRTGAPLEAVLSLMDPGSGAVRTRCSLGADEDRPASCDTPRGPVRGAPVEYWAVTELASRAGYGPLLLRSGSDAGAGHLEGAVSAP